MKLRFSRYQLRSIGFANREDRQRLGIENLKTSFLLFSALALHYFALRR